MRSAIRATLTTVLLLGFGWALLLSHGCGDDKATGPADPDLALSLQCTNGDIELRLANSGGPMQGDCRLVAAFADGTRDTLLLAPGAGETATCRLTNIHGPVTVTSDEWGLVASGDDCLMDGLRTYLAAIDLGDMIPSPLTSQSIVVCTYTFYLENLASAPPTAQLAPATGGVNLRVVFRSIHGDIRAVGSNWLCATIYGDVAVDSVVAVTEILIDEEGDPQVTLGSTNATVSGIHVNIDGTLGFLVEWLVSFFENDFADSLEAAIESAIAQFGDGISTAVVVRSDCSG